jgi:hypothetical protein
MGDSWDEIGRLIGEFTSKTVEVERAEENYELAMAHLEGKGVEKSYVKAFELFTKSAEHGNAMAQYQLGMMYYEGKGTEQSFEKSLYWFEKSKEGLEKGDYRGTLQSVSIRLAHQYYYGLGVKKDYKRAYDECRYIDTPEGLYLQYLTGKELGIRDPYKYDLRANKCLEESAEKGYVEAQYTLGMNYKNGYRVVQSYIEAYRWLAKAAEGGDTRAMYEIGTWYEEGKCGKMKSAAKARKWFKMAADLGMEDAKRKLGEMARSVESASYYEGRRALKQPVSWALVEVRISKDCAGNVPTLTL